MNEPGIFTDSFFAMGTRCDVVFTDIENNEAKRIFQIVKSETEKLDFLLSSYNPDSPLSKLNQSKRNVWINVLDESLWDVLTICHDFWQMSNGAFDITVAPMFKLWENNAIETVSDEDFIKGKSKIGFDKVELDFDQHRIKFLADGVMFDLSLITKGIAIDSLKPILQKEGIKNGIISFGESSILALGNHPNGDKWPLGIRNPYNPEMYIHLFSVEDSTVTTSGTISISETGETSRKHIISPATGYPVEDNKSVSVLSESATMGEFLSTAFLILPENDRNLIADKIKNIELLEIDYLADKDFKTKLTIL